MDQMDIDNLPDIPDTPDKLTAQNIKGKSVSGRFGNRNVFDDVTKIQSQVKDNGSGKYLMDAPKSAITSCDHRSSDFASGNPSSSNSFLLRRVTDEIPHVRKHLHHRKNEKSVYVKSSAGQDGSVVNPKECNGHVGVSKAVLLCGATESSRAEEYGKRLLCANKLSSSSTVSNSSITAHFANKGKEPKVTVSGFDCGNVVNCAQPKAGKVVSTSLSSTSLARVTGQKRLVRNGCISPHNIAKAKQSVVKDKDSYDVGANCTLPVVSGSPQIAIGTKEWIGDDVESHQFKGKGVRSFPLSVKDPDAQSAHLPSRNSVNISEIVKETSDTKEDAFRTFEEHGGWGSTRNRSKKISLPGSCETSTLPSEHGDTRILDGLPSYMVEKGEIGSAAGTSHNNPVDLDATSSRGAFLPSGEHSTSLVMSQVGQFNGQHPFAKTLSKRQRQVLASSSRGECSRAAMDDSDIIFLGSPENNAGKSRTIETVSQNSFSSLEPVIEIDETIPEARRDGSSNIGSSSNEASTLARQIEADEMLARELQEQLYNEAPSIGVGNIDAHVALALQHGEDLLPIRRSRTFQARNSSTGSSSRQSQSSSSLSLLHRGSQARAPNLNRMARLRNHFPGRPRTVASSMERTSLFPADMDVDYRMYLLETLEAINDMGVDNGFLETQRDFNENDYEMLLALDENNHQHGGASTARINGLPQSTVQRDNLEEACAVCLETPTLGETIRHLPCLHKFHKDCIDPWLRIRTSCPVCKSSVT
ncbi:hypothetical protein ACH5RR_032778 [Cinchona calisaya]|uniref:RING-type domain-containing protein n=1 Tax=Cinchona calisaya TaxID=153742 RepID=A0ABD2YJ48_9GENT